MKVTTPEDSRDEHEALTQHAEAVLKVSSCQIYFSGSFVYWFAGPVTWFEKVTLGFVFSVHIIDY